MVWARVDEGQWLYWTKDAKCRGKSEVVMEGVHGVTEEDA